MKVEAGHDIGTSSVEMYSTSVLKGSSSLLKSYSESQISYREKERVENRSLTADEQKEVDRVSTTLRSCK